WRRARPLRFRLRSARRRSSASIFRPGRAAEDRCASRRRRRRAAPRSRRRCPRCRYLKLEADSCRDSVHAPAMTLLEITPESHGVVLDIAYATPRNFTGKPVYGRPGCYLHADAAAKLAKAAALAAALGLRLKIFDAFRPSEAQWVLWNFRPDPEFLADPGKGSPHSRGVAVDLTLIDGRAASSTWARGSMRSRRCRT